MPFPRPSAHILWVCLVLVTASGCRTAGLRDLSQRDLPPARTDWTTTELLSEHNRNAAKIRSLEAAPSITVNRKGSVSGKLAMERPKHFNLVLSSITNEVANIGSNDQEFWFWVKDSQEKGVFYCSYDESGQSPLESGLQPEWIVESMGLEELTKDDIARAKVTKGKEPGTRVLTLAPANPAGGTVRELVVSETTRRVIEHRVLSPDRTVVLARATVSDWQDVELPSEGSTDAPEQVYLPRKFRLEWSKEGLTLDVFLNKPKINPTFTETRKSALFVKPEIDGTPLVDLRERAGLASNAPRPADSGTTIRHSIPAPAPRVRLAEPGPLGSSKPAQRTTLARGGDDADPRPELDVARPFGNGGSVIEEVVGPRIPTVSQPTPGYLQNNSGWKGRFGSALER